jgi:hypothetical protein
LGEKDYKTAYFGLPSPLTQKNSEALGTPYMS